MLGIPHRVIRFGGDQWRCGRPKPDSQKRGGLLRHIPLIGAILAAGLWAASTAVADLQAGVAAFEAGDADRALVLLLPEAEAGNARAQFLLGELLSSGAVQRDLDAATEWYRKAAEGGVAEAQFQLGMRYSVGLGLAQDLVQAYRWLSIAGQSLKTEAAVQFVQTFIDKMSEAEIVQAEDLVAAWVGVPEPEPAATPEQPTLATSIPVSRRSAEAAVREALQAHPCSDVQVVALGEDHWRLTGVVEEAEDDGALVSALAQLVPALHFETKLQAVGRPICAAAAITAGFGDQARLSMAPAAGKTDFSDGEIVAIDVDLPEEPGYLYVDYYQLDGQVVHVLPLVDVVQERTETGGRLRFGDGSAGLTLRVGPPFGVEMLTVFVAPARLFEEPRPLVEDGETYLIELAERAKQLVGSGGAVLSDSLLITTLAGE